MNAPRSISPSRAVLGAVALLMWTWPLHGQSLAEVARKEEARRKALAQSGKVYTAADLKPVAQPVSGTPASDPAAATPAVTPAGGGATPGGGAGDPGQAPVTSPPDASGQGEEPVKDEAWWRKRITDARAELARTETLIAALESRANALLNDFVARDDPAQRAVIARDRQVTLDELARMKAERQKQAEAIPAIEEEARQAGVPPGWLRVE